MKLPLFPNRYELQDKWWHRLAQVLVLVSTLLGLLLGLLISSEGEDLGVAIFLPLIIYAIGIGVYHTILYVGFGHSTSVQHSNQRKSQVLSKEDKIAVHLKWCNALFLSGVLAFILYGVSESELLGGVAGIIVIGFLYCVIAIQIMVWQSGWKYVGIVFLFLGGLIGLIIFCAAYDKAVKISKKSGYTIGLFGPKEITFFGQKLLTAKSETLKLKSQSMEKKQTTSSVQSTKQRQTANQWFLKIESLESAKKAVAQGYIAAYIIAGLTAIIALIALLSEESIGGIDEWAMLDALLMAVAGIGMQFYSRVAALGALGLFVLGKVVMLSEGQLTAAGGVMAVILFLALLNGVRGTFAYRRFQHVYAAQS